MSEFAEKVRTIGAPRRTGQTERKAVTNEDNGSVAGFQFEHWDGRRSAVVTPPTVKFKVGVNDDG